MKDKNKNYLYFALLAIIFGFTFEVLAPITNTTGLFIVAGAFLGIGITLISVS